jgi:hypothetical protein
MPLRISGKSEDMRAVPKPRLARGFNSLDSCPEIVPGNVNVRPPSEGPNGFCGVTIGLGQWVAAGWLYRRMAQNSKASPGNSPAICIARPPDRSSCSHNVFDVSSSK